MKKLIVLLVVLFSSNVLLAQNDQIINATIGIGGSVQGAKIKTPAIYGSYENFISENLSVGGILGYSTTSVTTFDFVLGEDVEDNNANIVIGGLANYYVVRDEQFDVYFGASLGYASELTGSFLYEFHAGGRYHISEKIAINSELGFGLSLAKIGLSFKL